MLFSIQIGVAFPAAAAVPFFWEINLVNVKFWHVHEVGCTHVSIAVCLTDQEWKVAVLCCL